MRALRLTPNQRMRARAKSNRNAIVAAFDAGTTRAELMAKYPTGSVVLALKDLPPNQERSRSAASEVVESVERRHGLTFMGVLRSHSNHIVFGEPSSAMVWPLLRDVLDHRTAKGWPLSLGAIAEVSGLRWQYISRCMELHGYSRGVREDHR